MGLLLNSVLKVALYSESLDISYRVFSNCYYHYRYHIQLAYTDVEGDKLILLWIIDKPIGNCLIHNMITSFLPLHTVTGILYLPYKRVNIGWFFLTMFWLEYSISFNLLNEMNMKSFLKVETACQLSGYLNIGILLSFETFFGRNNERWVC